MNTRFAAVAGTLLVGLSLFVTTLITQNLNNNALSSSSEAQEVSCRIDGSVRTRINGDGTRCFFYHGQCRKNGSNTVIRTNCYGTREEAQAAAQVNCCGAGSAPSVTPLPTSTTAPGEPSATPVPGSCNGNGEYPGKRCGEDGFSCCSGLVCTNGESGGPAKCGPRPTVPPCNEAGIYWDKTCSVLNCCSKQCSDVVGVGAVCGRVPTQVPSPTPTAPLNLNSCYNERCKFQDGRPTCSNGRTCVVIGSEESPTEESCDSGANCRCVLNVQCRLPGGYEPGNKEKESCWCLNPSKCIPSDGNWDRYSCLDDEKCKLIDPTFTCKGADKGVIPPIFGTCGNEYCPDPTPTPTAVPRPGFQRVNPVPAVEKYPYLLRIDRNELPRYILRAIGLQ